MGIDPKVEESARDLLGYAMAGPLEAAGHLAGDRCGLTRRPLGDVTAYSGNLLPHMARGRRQVTGSVIPGARPPGFPRSSSLVAARARVAA
jgi:hypothetical protein